MLNDTKSEQSFRVTQNISKGLRLDFGHFLLPYIKGRTFRPSQLRPAACFSIRCASPKSIKQVKEVDNGLCSIMRGTIKVW